MRPFGFREAAGFWDAAADPELAFRLHALVGGTPEYRAMCGGAGPRSLAGFDRWVQRRLLDPASVTVGEGAAPPGEESRRAAAAAPASCAWALGGSSAGRGRPSEIPATLGRPEAAV